MGATKIQWDAHEPTAINCQHVPFFKSVSFWIQMSKTNLKFSIFQNWTFDPKNLFFLIFS